MSLYFFDIRSYGEQQDFRGGRSMPDDETALAHARRMVAELRGAGGYDDAGLTLVVRNSTGRMIFSLPFVHKAAVGGH